MSLSNTIDDSTIRRLLCNTWYGDDYEGDLFRLNADGTGEVR